MKTTILAAVVVALAGCSGAGSDADRSIALPDCGDADAVLVEPPDVYPPDRVTCAWQCTIPALPHDLIVNVAWDVYTLGADGEYTQTGRGVINPYGQIGAACAASVE